MITRLSLANFQCWRKVDLDLGRITLLYGANSSGKTALLRSLLLLRQRAVKVSDSFSLGLGESGLTVDLGSWSDVAFGHDADATIRIGFEFLNGQSETTGQTFHWANEDQSTRVRDWRIAVPGFTLDAHYAAGESVHVKSGNEAFMKAYQGVAQEIRREGLIALTRPLTVPPLTAEELHAHDLVLRETMAHDHYFKNMDYQAALRWPFQRLYPTAGSEIHSIDPSGLQAIHAYWRSRHGAAAERFRGADIVSGVNHWLRKLGLASEFELRSSGPPDNVAAPEVTTPESGAPTSAADAGIGLSQVFPILARAYFAPEGSMLIVEQPEAHLHPAAQAELADFFLAVARKRHLQLVIESHSEYLLARLQRRMAEADPEDDQSPANPEYLKIYFCENHPKGAEAVPIETDEYGHILNWPAGFFGDAMGDMVALEKARIARDRKKARSA